jgi:ABC-type multidrug transport system ATPase subunit
LGANGAGKTTLLRILAGLSRADAGRVLLDGAEPARRRVGYLGHNHLLYAHLTIEENLELVASLTLHAPLDRGHLARWGLDTLAGQKPSELSKGLQFRAGLARAFLHRPSVLVLDEPTSALDDSSVEILAAELQGAAASRPAAAVIATHDVARLSPLATRIVLLSEGKVSRDARTERERNEVIETYRRMNR